MIENESESSTSTRLAGVRQRASQEPIGTFLFILITLAAIVSVVQYTIYGLSFPDSAVIVYAWTPMISAGVTVWAIGESVRDWIGQLGNVRVGLHWYLVGIGIMVLGTEFETIIALILGGDVVAPQYPLIGYVINFAITLFLAGAIEELGWRGFLQPRLQRRFSALSASVAIGALWGLWHVPMIVAGAGDFTVFWEYMINIIVISVIFGWLYNSTDGALLVVMIAHAAHNMPAFGDATTGVPDLFTVISGDVVLYLASGLAITLYAGTKTLTHDGDLPDVPGRLSEFSI